MVMTISLRVTCLRQWFEAVAGSGCRGGRRIAYRGGVTQQPRPVRRAPRIGPFLISGGLLGFVVGLLLSVFGPETATYSLGRAVGFLGLGCAAIGVLLAGLVYVLLDRRS
jgi:hypothetical protein